MVLVTAQTAMGRVSKKVPRNRAISVKVPAHVKPATEMANAIYARVQGLDDGGEPEFDLTPHV